MLEQLSYYELQILDFIRNVFACKVGDGVMQVITLFGEGGVFWIGMTVVLLALPKTRSLGVRLAISLALEAILCNVLIKPMVARIRPYELNPNVLIPIRCPGDYSFPSGHTGASFAMAGVFLLTKNKYRIPVTILASLVAVSRIYFYIHYPTDVLAGILLGMLSAYVAVKLAEKLSAGKQIKKH